jgi:hypothetical protein
MGIEGKTSHDSAIADEHSSSPIRAADCGDVFSVSAAYLTRSLTSLTEDDEDFYAGRVMSNDDSSPEQPSSYSSGPSAVLHLDASRKLCMAGDIDTNMDSKTGQAIRQADTRPLNPSAGFFTPATHRVAKYDRDTSPEERDAILFTPFGRTPSGIPVSNSWELARTRFEAAIVPAGAPLDASFRPRADSDPIIAGDQIHGNGLSRFSTIPQFGMTAESLSIRSNVYIHEHEREGHSAQRDKQGIAQPYRS